MDDPAIDAGWTPIWRWPSALGIDGTPALVIGDALVPGAIELADLEKAIATARAAR